MNKLLHKGQNNFSKIRVNELLSRWLCKASSSFPFRRKIANSLRYTNEIIFFITKYNLGSQWFLPLYLTQESFCMDRSFITLNKTYSDVSYEESLLPYEFTSPCSGNENGSFRGYELEIIDFGPFQRLSLHCHCSARC